MCALRDLSDISCTNYSINIIYYKVFFVLFPESIFPKECIFCILAEENQEVFSERCSLISGVL